MSGRLVVIGAGGHGVVVAESAKLQGDWQEIVFLDDAPHSAPDIGGFELLGTSAELSRVCGKKDQFVVAIGENRARQELFERGMAAGCNSGVVVHPQSVISESALIGQGSVVFANSTIAARTSVGRAVIVNHAALIDHDCMVGHAVHIAPGAHVAGGVKIGDRSWIGLGATVNQSLEIGNDVMVGSSAAVVESVAATDFVVGVPARSMKSTRK